MMQLLSPSLILAAPYALLTLAGWSGSGCVSTRGLARALPLSLFFAFTGIGHFIKTDELVSMMPASVPYRPRGRLHHRRARVPRRVGIWIQHSAGSLASALS
jgi:hypothetical protein